MTRDDIIRMAQEVGIKGPAPARQGFKMYANPQRLERFAALVAAAEREACAKVCEDNADDLSEGDWDPACNNCAAAIRARGQE